MNSLTKSEMENRKSVSCRRRRFLFLEGKGTLLKYECVKRKITGVTACSDKTLKVNLLL